MHSIFFGKGFSFHLRYLSLIFRNIAFISHNDLGYMFRLALVNLLQPVLQTIESFSIINRINEHDSSSSFIIRFSNSFETFLTCSIPYLHFNFDTIYRDGFDFKINTNCGDVRHLVLLVNISKQDVRFANGSISDDNHLD